MRNNNKALLIVAILAVGGVVGFVAFGASTVGSIEDEFNFTYEPSSPDPVEALNFNVDIGSLHFKYNNSPTTYFAEIDVDMEITGWYMEGKTYLDFFNPSTDWWDDVTATLTLQTLPGAWFDPSHWFKSYNVSVEVILRTDVVYDITALTSVGSVEMEVDETVVLNGTSLTASTGSITFNTLGYNDIMGNVRLETSTGSIESSLVKTNFQGFKALTSTGSISLNYTNCVMAENLEGKTSTGSVSFKSYNMFYPTDILLNLETSTGSIDAELYQYIDIGANVSGTWETSSGSVDVLYRDNSVNNDVRFVGSTGTGSINYTPHATMAITGLGSIYSTLNYGDATYRYEFSLDTSTGSISADSQSA